MFACITRSKFRQLLALLILTCSMFHYIPSHAATKVGFNYYPEGYWSNFLHDKNWLDQNVKAQTASDLEHLASLGVEFVRVMLFTFDGSVAFSKKGMTFKPEYEQQKKNLVEFLGLCKQYGIRVILTSENWHSKDKWQAFYKNNEAKYLADSLKWTSGLFHTVQQSPHADAIYFYDLQNEAAMQTEGSWGGYTIHGKLVATLYDGLKIPQEKRGLSVLFADTDQLLMLRKAMESDGVQRRDFAYMDFHVYPHVNQYDLNWHRSLAKKAFPKAKWIIGEAGIQAGKNDLEDTQAEWAFGAKGLYRNASNYNFPVTTWWLFWDYPDDGARVKQTFGLSYKRHEPKELLGGLANYMDRLVNVEGDKRFPGVIKNPDMEKTQSGQLLHWRQGQSLSSSKSKLLVRQQKSESAEQSAATGLQAANIDFSNIPKTKTHSSNPLRVWLESEPLKVGAKRQVFANFYFRTQAIHQVRLVVMAYDQQGKLLTSLNGQWVKPKQSGFMSKKLGPWQNYLALAGAQNFVAPEGTTQVVLRAEAEPSKRLKDAHLDLDIFSGSTR